MIDHHQRCRRFVHQIAGCAVLALTLLGCSDDPTEQNALVAPGPLPNVIVRDTLIYAARDSSFLNRLAMEGVANLVGAGSGYTATAVIQFTPGLFPPRDTVRVFSATLKLYVKQRLGLPGDLLDFEVYRMNRSWSPTGLTWDSLQAGIYDRSQLRGRFQAAVPADTGWVSVALDTVMVREWLRTSTSTEVTKYGIALVPAPLSRAVIAFQSFEGDSASWRPTLTIVAGNSAGGPLDTASYTGGIDTFAGDGPAPADPASLFIQAGVAYRGFLSFDVSFMKQGTTVNSAQLVVTRLPNPDFVARLRDTTLAVHLGTGTDLRTFEGTTLAALRPVDGSPATLSGDVRHIVQSWVGRPNYGMVLRAASTSEFSSFNLFRLAGIRSTDPSFRPRLRITYTEVPLGRQS